MYIPLPALREHALVALLLFHSIAVYAQQCTISNSRPDISFGDISIGRDVAVGQAISTRENSTISVSCPESPAGFYMQYFSPLAVSTTVRDVWETGTAGIGVRVMDEGSALSNATRGDFGPPTASAANARTFRFAYQLVKTGATNVSNSVAVPSMFELRSHRIAAGQTSNAQAPTGINTTAIRAQSCTVATTAITVELPKVSTTQLSTIGATAGSAPFAIGLSCQGGGNIHITLSDATTPTNRTNQLSLASSSTASGLRLRILNAGRTAISFGPDSAAAGTENQWRVGPFAPTVTIPLIAEYIATGTVRAGTISARATFTMSYQ